MSSSQAAVAQVAAAISAVDATKLQGKLTAQQIAAVVDATKLQGKLTAQQIAAAQAAVRAVKAGHTNDETKSMAAAGE